MKTSQYFVPIHFNAMSIESSGDVIKQKYWPLGNEKRGQKGLKSFHKFQMSIISPRFKS